ncbi:dimethylglycine dehydrogenase, mitochondrial-like [Ptychodera flava]|uniref:dimethylglycine dehydrogenase, mitochondrial-like n=1 Tax=Ptychodera flava TaxID=63121 RepID=UPI00396A896E
MYICTHKHNIRCAGFYSLQLQEHIWPENIVHSDDLSEFCTFFPTMAFMRRGSILLKNSLSFEGWVSENALRTIATQSKKQWTSADVNNIRSEKSKSYSTKGLQKRVKDDADTVIIGGGALGTSTAYHLAKAGMKDVVLLEKSELTAGATWHAAGLATFYQPIINMKKITRTSLSLYKEIAEETGQQVGFHKPGTIRLATTPTRVDEMRYQMQRHGWHSNMPQRIIGPEEIHQLHPLLNMEKILAGLYMEGDGHIDPYSLTQAYAIGARKYGAEIYQHSPVLGLKQTSDGKWDVETQHGTIRANRVINAAGFWSREVGEMIGIEVPMMTMQHQYIVTSTVPELKKLGREVPVVRDLDGSYYVRQERSGLLVGPYENQENMIQQNSWLKGVPPGFGRELFESDLDRISEHLEVAMEMVPALQTADIQTVVCGPYPYSPDAAGLAGPYPGLRNYWIINGCSGGIVWSGGLGKYLTDWIVSGEPPHDLIELDPARYGKWLTKEYLTAKTRETYSFNNKQLFPFEERFAGRPTERISGAYQKMKDRGAEFGLRAGWEQPNWFALPPDEKGYKPSYHRTNWFKPVGRECRIVMNNAGIIDLTSSGKFEIHGKDARALMDYLCATELPQVGDSGVAYMLTPSGKIYGELTICRLAKDHFFCVSAAAAELHHIRWIEDHAFQGNFDVQITNITDDRACLGIAGPKSREVLQLMTEKNLSHNSFLPGSTKSLSLDGIPVFAIRASSTGELGYELYHDKQHTAKLYDALLSAGDSYGIGDFGSYAANTMRMEKGYRTWGRELTVDYNPFEAGLDEDIHFDKDGDFIGKVVLPKLKENLSRKLVLLKLDSSDDNVDPAGYESVWSESKVVGNTTSGGYSYSTKQGIAYAYLPLNLTSVGSTVEVEMMGNHYTATVIQEPLLESDKLRKKLDKEDRYYSYDDHNTRTLYG